MVHDLRTFYFKGKGSRLTNALICCQVYDNADHQSPTLIVFLPEKLTGSTAWMSESFVVNRRLKPISDNSCVLSVNIN